MKKFLKQFRHGQRGFTLIELLVVIAILGILAAVVVPNVTKFMGAGTVEAANTEAHNVQLAVVACMADMGLTTFTGDVGPATTTGPEEFLLNPAGLQAVYTITDGAITAAASDIVAMPDGSKWADLVYAGVGHVGEGWHEPD